MTWDTKRVIALGATVAALTQIGRFGDGAVWLWRSPSTAYAALTKADDSKTWIDAYIADQQKQREFDQKLAEREAVYQQQMLELQQQQVQQQVPNQAAPWTQPTSIREWDGTEQTFWCCPHAPEERERCWEQDAQGRSAWWRCP